MAEGVANLNPVELLAIAKGIPEKVLKKARDAIKPGVYHIDEVIRIRGSLSVGEDYERTPTASIPLLETMALLLAKMAPKDRLVTKALLVEAMSEAIAETGHGQGAVLEENKKLVMEAMTHVREVTGLLPPVKVRGACKATVTVEGLVSPISSEFLDEVDLTAGGGS